MRRTIFRFRLRDASLLSIVSLATACSFRPFTPSVSVAFTTQEVPLPKTLTIPSTRVVAARWELAPTDPWARYEKSTLISSLDAIGGVEGGGGHAELPDVTELDVLYDATRAARRLGEIGMPAGTLWICDMRGAASVAFGAALPRYTKDPISPVLTFNNWPAETGLVPADETLAALVLMAPPRPPRETPNGHPVFLLDSWRLAYRDDDPGDAYDNRYMLQPHELPSAEELRRHGIERVVYLVESLDDTEGEEDDLQPVLIAWQASGVGVHLVDLAWLSGLTIDVDWGKTLAPSVHRVERRPVLQDDPQFYARARGGFGFAYGHSLFFPGGFSRGRGGYDGSGTSGGGSGYGGG